jgi:hypothetical protein
MSHDPFWIVFVVEVNLRPSASLAWCQAPIWSSWPYFSFLSDNDHILFSHLRLPQLGEPGTAFISPRNRVAQLYPRALGSRFVTSYDSQGYGGGVRSQSQSYIMTSSQSASLSWCQAPIWDPRPVVPLLSSIIFRQLRVCWCGAPSLTRSRVCTFQFLPGVTSSAVLRCESRGTHEHILLSLFFRLPQPGGPGFCIYFPQE